MTTVQSSNIIHVTRLMACLYGANGGPPVLAAGGPSELY